MVTIGIAKGIPTDFTEEKIKQQARTREGFPIHDIYGFKSKITKTNGIYAWIPTQMVKLTFQSQSLPDQVFIYGATASLELCIQPIRQYRNCLNYGRLSKFCK